MRTASHRVIGRKLGAAESLFIAWSPRARAQRTRRIAALLDIESCFVHFLPVGRPLIAPLKYPIQVLATWRLLWHKRPRIVLVQNPPIIAVLVVALYTHLVGARYIIDSHTGALLGPRWQWSQGLHRWLSCHALATVVTNPFLCKVLLQGKGVASTRVLILEDPPAEWCGRSSDFPPLPGSRQVVIPSSFNSDEPIQELLSAASLLPDISFAITGDLHSLPAEVRAACPPNVRLTGWLSETDYSALLQSANVVVCLTTEDHTLLCGAWEALYAGQPLVTSEWPFLREAIPQGAVFTPAISERIAEAIELAINNESQLREAMQALALSKRQAWETSFADLRRLVDTGS